MAKKHSAATRQKISHAQKGRKNSFYGRHHTKEARRRIKAATKGRNNPMFGRHHTAATKKKISLKARLWRARAAKLS